MFKRMHFGLLASAAAAMFALPKQIIPLHERITPSSYQPTRIKSHGRRGSKDRLHPGRSSSVRKLQRWLNNGDIVQESGKR
jgi:hypothetical protein